MCCLASERFMLPKADDILRPLGFWRVATLSPFDASWGDAFYVRRSGRD